MFRRFASGLCWAFLSTVILSAPGTAASLPPETIAARQHYFGLDNVDPRTGTVRSDRVILSWTGVSGFAAALKGHVVLLDAYIARQGGVSPGGQPIWPGMAYVGTTPQELAALKPELVLIGHTHFDHAGDLPEVVRANPGLVVAGTAEHCADFKQVMKEAKFTCVSVFEAGAALGTTKVFHDLLPGVILTAVKQPHSMPPKEAGNDPPFPFPPKRETCPVYAEYPGASDPPAWTAPEVGPPSGLIAIAWQIRIGDFALMWQDTAGTIKGTGVPEAFARLAPTDVRIGAIAVSPRSVLNEHILALKPKLFVPIHHDPCAAAIREELEKQLATLPPEARPALWFLSDPGDYLRPLSFDSAAKVWKDH